MPHKEGHLLVDVCVKRGEKDIEHPVEYCEILITLDDVSITPSQYKDTGVLPNSVAREEGNCSWISVWPMLTLKQSLMAVMG